MVAFVGTARVRSFLGIADVFALLVAFGIGFAVVCNV